jgi:hypothetical protein
MLPNDTFVSPSPAVRRRRGQCVTAASKEGFMDRLPSPTEMPDRDARLVFEQQASGSRSRGYAGEAVRRVARSGLAAHPWLRPERVGVSVDDIR